MSLPVLITIETDLGFNYKSVSLNNGYRFGKSANFSQLGCIGRSGPLITYANSNAMEFAFDGMMVALTDEDDHGAQHDVADFCKSMKSLVCAIKSGVTPPTLCYITTPGILDQWVCVCAAVNFNPGNLNLYDEEGIPMSTTFSATFLEIMLDPIDANDTLVSGDYGYIAYGGYGA